MKPVCIRVRSLHAAANAVICVLIIGSAALAQNWRGLEPIKSTCKDVEHLLGGKACGLQTVRYNLPEETVRIVFAVEPCHEKWPYERYNVSPGTVTDIIVIPRAPKRLFISDLNVEESKLRKKEASDLIYSYEYVSKEMGIEFTASDEGQVTNVIYFPATRYDHLRCPHSTKLEPSSELTVYGATPFLSGEYSPASVANEKQALDKLVSDLKDFDARMTGGTAQKATVYVMAYAGRQSRAGEAQQLADRVKNCLVRERDIDVSRIKVVDAGYHESALIQLFIRPYGASVPNIQPTIHPNKVTIVSSKNK